MEPITLTYSQVDGLTLDLDIYLPQTIGDGAHLPSIVHFHGGGLTGGGKRDALFPTNIRDLTLARNVAFISANYRLLHPYTGAAIIEDVKTLFSFLASPSLPSQLKNNASLDVSHIAVYGASGGGYAAGMAALHASPRPKAILSAFGQDLDLFDDSYLGSPGHKILPDIPPRSSVPAILSTAVPGKRAEINSEFNLETMEPIDRHGFWSAACWLIYHGLYHDWITGRQGLSDELKKLRHSERERRLKELGLSDFYPQIGLEDKAKALPTIIYIGERDRITPASTAKHRYEALKRLGVKTELIVVPNADHGLLEKLWTTFVPEVPDVERKVVDWVVQELNTA